MLKRGRAIPEEARGHGFLSDEAERIRARLGIPIRALPAARETSSATWREELLGLDRQIRRAGPPEPVARLLRAGLGARAAEHLDRNRPLGPRPLWHAPELAELGPDDLEGLARLWRRRIRRDSPVVTSVIRSDLDPAAVWRTLPGGDFDSDGRGHDYTRGMDRFQPTRWPGVRRLLELVGEEAAGNGAPAGAVLDVLGGDGYVVRLEEAARRRAEIRLVIAEEDGLDARSVAASLHRHHAGMALLATRPDGTARLAAVIEGEAVESPPFDLAGRAVERLAERSGVAVVGPGPAPVRTARAIRHARANRLLARKPRILTNDLSGHMFRRAGLVGPTTREAAGRLDRTFEAGSLGGVLLAYGTHHIPEPAAALRQAARLLRPGGAVVVHDFLAEGPVGQWFHRIVDVHSRTGHDFPHLGPVRMAALLLAAGFGDLEIYELDDPFVFHAPPGATWTARQAALSYVLGMYGMGDSLGDAPDRLQRMIERTLTYSGDRPELGDRLAYIPRRAVVVRAEKSPPGAQALSPADRTLARRIDRLLRASPDHYAADLPESVAREWFAPDGSRWGLTPAEQETWFAWRRAADDGAGRPHIETLIDIPSQSDTEEVPT